MYIGLRNRGQGSPQSDHYLLLQTSLGLIPYTHPTLTQCSSSRIALLPPQRAFGNVSGRGPTSI